MHNHSTWSDGVHTLEQMATFCKDDLKLEYLGICDHSKSAFYANGLNEQRVYAQHQEIDALNIKLAPFKIFKGIESDILYDGSLDYPEEILKTFDFVVASIHSNIKMDEEKATARLIKAIENPYTTILGHPTGRLLLSRKGYPIDYAKVIDACAANKVVIEINSNPLRLGSRLALASIMHLRKVCCYPSIPMHTGWKVSTTCTTELWWQERVVYLLDNA